MTSVYVDAKVDIDDVLCNIGCDDLAKYLRSAFAYAERHKLAKALLTDKPNEREEEPDDLSPFVEEALSMLKAGRVDDAELILERAAHPKWRTVEAALLALKSVRQ